MLKIPSIFPETRLSLFHKNFAEPALSTKEVLAFNPFMCVVSELALWTKGWIDKTPTERAFKKVAKLTIEHLHTKYSNDSQIRCYFNTIKLYREIKDPSEKSKKRYNEVSGALIKFFRASVQ